MNEQQFKDQYVATFLASYMASRYNLDCINGHPIAGNQPLEDAMFLADEAWKQYYDPYTIGYRLYKDGHGISSIAGAVLSDDDMYECQRGYDDAQKQSIYE